MMGSADITYPNPFIPRELLVPPPFHPISSVTDPRFAYMQDIIEHEYALVESIPEEDKAGLMPIIRFIRNTLQNPVAGLIQPSTESAVDALRIANAARTGTSHGDQGIATFSHRKREDSIDIMPHLSASHKMQSQFPKRLVICEFPRNHTLEGTCTSHDYSTGQISESFRALMSWDMVASKRTTCCQQGTGTEHSLQQNAPINTSDGIESANTTLHSVPAQSEQGQQLKEGLTSLCSMVETVDCEQNTLTSVKNDPDIKLTKNHSSTVEVVDGFKLEELRRSLRPADDKVGSDDLSDIQSMEANVCAEGGLDAEDDNGEEENNSRCSHSCESYEGEEQDASDVEWPLNWSSESMSPTILLEENLQFPKITCRRRNVVKKSVGWIGKVGAQPLFARVRHKRQCNLPCCTDCESVSKRRKTTGNGLKKCSRISSLNKFVPAMALTTVQDFEADTRNNSWPQIHISRINQHVPGSPDICNDKEGSQVSQDLMNSPLATALTMVLMNSKRGGLTSNEASHTLIQSGYSEALGFEREALALHVKATLRECPQFKELKNHRFVLRPGTNQATDCTGLGSHNLGGNHVTAKGVVRHCPSLHKSSYEDYDEACMICSSPLQKRESCCQEKIRTKRKSLHMINARCGSSCGIDVYLERDCKVQVSEEDMLETLEDSSSRQMIEDNDVDQIHPTRCCRTDGKNWQCANQALVGSAYCLRHQNRCKKAVTKNSMHQLDILGGKKNIQIKCGSRVNCDVSSVRNFCMQLRSRRKTIYDKSLEYF